MGQNEDREQRIHDARMDRLAREEADKAKLVAELDQAVKDGNRLADALVKSREEVANLKLQIDEAKGILRRVVENTPPNRITEDAEAFLNGKTEKRKCECVWLDGGPLGDYRDRRVQCSIHDKKKA